MLSQIFTTLFILSFAQAATNIEKTVKEAENLTLLQDRLSACALIYKTYKKNPSKQLKEKLFYFSKYFYTDKGFQGHLLGKELLDKEKYLEAVEKLVESDQLEKGNTEVLHTLAISYMWLKKTKPALEANSRALQINPLDEELIKDRLAIEASAEDWAEVIVTAEEFSKHGEGGALAAYFKGVALLKTGKTEEAKTFLESALSKDKKYPETYFWLSELEESPAKKQTLLAKYNELCKNKKSVNSERDLNLCSRATPKSV